MTCLIVRLLAGKLSVRFFFPHIYLFLPRSYPRQNLNALEIGPLRSDRTVFRKKQASTNSIRGNFVLQKVPLKKSKSSINFVRHFLDKQRNVLKIIDIRVALVTFRGT